MAIFSDASLTSPGIKTRLADPSAWTDISDWDNLVGPNRSQILIPALRTGRAEMTYQRASVMRNWVEAGGDLVVIGSTEGVGVLNEMFGWTLTPDRDDKATWQRQPEADRYAADWPMELPQWGEEISLHAYSLPLAATPLYWASSEASVSVVVITIGNGFVTWVAQDPVNTAVLGWRVVLAGATNLAIPKPVSRSPALAGKIAMANTPQSTITTHHVIVTDPDVRLCACVRVLMNRYFQNDR